MINPEDDFLGFVKETVAETVDKKLEGDKGTDNTPQGLKLNIGGQEYQYQNKEELEKALNTFVSHVGTQMQELQAKVVEPAVEGSFVTGKESDEDFNKEFIDTMTKSPKEGFTLALNKLLFDGKSEDPIGDIKRGLTETELTKRTIAAYQFKENHAEFTGGKQYADVIEKYREKLGLPYDVNGIEASYLLAMKRGDIPDFYALKQQADERAKQEQVRQSVGFDPSDPFGVYNTPSPFSNTNNPYLTAPPGVNRNNPNTSGGIDPETLTMDQIEAIFARAGKPVK